MKSSLRLKNFYLGLNRIARITILGGILLMPVSVIGQEMTQQCGQLLQGQRFSLVVPYGPGGGYDAYAGVFATSFSALTDSTMRIGYLPGAGGIRGINAVIEAGPADQVLGLFSPNILLNEQILGRVTAEIDSLTMLGSMFVDSTVWISREDDQVESHGLAPQIFGMGSNSDFVRILLPGFALCWNIVVIRGYSGTSELIFALLRGDIDFIYGSASTMVNQLNSFAGLNVYLSLTNGAGNLFPGVQYLSGEGSLLERLAADMTEEQRRERTEVAKLAIELSKSYRAISISRNADQTLVSCLRVEIQRTLFSKELENLAESQGLLIEPLGGVDLQSEIERVETLIEGNRELMDRLSQSYIQR